jgi:uncharacterized protein (TIGR02271 family)
MCEIPIPEDPMQQREPLRPDEVSPRDPAHSNIAHLRSHEEDLVRGDTEPLRVVELREEQLVAQKQLVDLGEVVVRTTVEDVPGHIEIDALREEVEVEHVPVGEVVTDRREPWEENGVLVIPMYEEQLVVVKRLVLREQLRVRRVGTVKHQVFEDTLQKERLVVEDPNGTGLVHELYPKGEDDHSSSHSPGFLDKLIGKGKE